MRQKPNLRPGIFLRQGRTVWLVISCDGYGAMARELSGFMLGEPMPIEAHLTVYEIVPNEIIFRSVRYEIGSFIKSSSKGKKKEFLSLLGEEWGEMLPQITPSI
jgi:hypothetical protein